MEVLARECLRDRERKRIDIPDRAAVLGESASGKVWLRPFTSNIEAASWTRVDGLNHVRLITLDEHGNLIGVTADGVVFVPARDTLRILNKAELDAKVEQPTQ